jgi:hypothetical protein
VSPPTPLENLSGPGGSLKPEPPDAAEIAGLLRTGSTRLNNATNATLALEGRLSHPASWANFTEALRSNLAH